ncbi:MAG TPA: MFS transporter [Anaeromyxobacteraceae bacterium]|nr:MFS transporter [Anaeromyxobacteraceae bacterium]
MKPIVLEEAKNTKARWLTPSVVGFGLASFLSDMGHEAATAALPALLVLLGSPPAALGIIEGVSDGLSSFAKLAGGFWADRPSARKPIAVAGYLATGVTTAAYGAATAWWHLLASRGAGWFARGARGPARDAMLSDAVPREALGRAFGLHRAADTAGAIVGPAAAAALLTVVPLRHVFLYATIPGVLAGVAFLALVRPQRETPRPALRFWHSVRALPRPYRRFLVAVFLFGLGDFARSLLILRATELLTPGAGPVKAAATAMSLYVLHNVIYAAASYPVGLLADRRSPRALLAIGYGVGTATAVLAAVATPAPGMLIALFLAAGLTLAFEDTLEGTIAALDVPQDVRGTGYGVLAAVNGAGDLLSSSLVGVLWSVAGAAAAFWTAATLCLAGTIALVAATRSGR